MSHFLNSYLADPYLTLHTLLRQENLLILWAMQWTRVRLAVRAVAQWVSSFWCQNWSLPRWTWRLGWIWCNQSIVLAKKEILVRILPCFSSQTNLSSWLFSPSFSLFLRLLASVFPLSIVFEILFTFTSCIFVFWQRRGLIGGWCPR